MNTRYYFKFLKGHECIQRQRTDFKEAHKEGNDLADRLGTTIGFYIWDSNMKQFKFLGSFYGKRMFLARDHRVCNISSDYSHIVRDGDKRKGVQL
ncbi:MAG: hypothetical protein J6X22_03975 [Muribaculaceae bacterium]|nr:hypothetical protein [Muribaculaceae bacterium]